MAYSQTADGHTDAELRTMTGPPAVKFATDDARALYDFASGAAISAPQTDAERVTVWDDSVNPDVFEKACEVGFTDVNVHENDALGVMVTFRRP